MGVFRGEESRFFPLAVLNKGFARVDFERNIMNDCFATIMATQGE